MLASVAGTAPHYRLVAKRPGPLDELTLECEPADGGADPGPLRERLAHVLQQQTGLRITVTVLAPGSIPRSEGKAVRVADRRPGAR